MFSVQRSSHFSNLSAMFGMSAGINRDSSGTSLKLPSFAVRGELLYCDSEAVSFSSSAKKLDLLRAFVASRGYQLSRQEILARVYGYRGQGQASIRFQNCLNSNVVKLISDTRRILKNALNERFPGIEWLVHNAKERRWKLMRFNEDYVLAHVEVQSSI